LNNNKEITIAVNKISLESHHPYLIEKESTVLRDIIKVLKYAYNSHEKRIFVDYNQHNRY